MTRLPLPYIHRFADRRGHVRYYFRRHGKRWPLPGRPGDAEFHVEYNRLLATAAPATTAPAAGTMHALVSAWYQSARFKALSPSSATTYRRIGDWFVAEHGPKLVIDLTPAIILELVDSWSAKPAMANKRLMVLRLLMKFAFERRWRPDNPTVGVDKVRHKAKGFPAWTDAEIAAFEARWPVGTRERLAFELLLMTGQRRSDVIRMGPRDLRDGGIEVRQQKTDTPLWLPVDPLLRAAIDGCQVTGTGTFLITQYGKPFASPTGFYNWFREAARKAGVEKSPHGLRKANQRIIAEQGGTMKQAMAVSGHRTTGEFERYSREAEQKGLARHGIEALRKGRGKGDG